MISSHLQQIVSGSVLISLNHDLIYLCDSLSILHCNIASLVQPLFLQTVARLADLYWQQVETEFVNQISTSLFWMKSVVITNVLRLKSKNALLLYQSEVREKGNSENELLPGYLMEVPILAKLLNDFISTFNELRFVAIRGNAAVICESMNDHLLAIARALISVNELVKQIIVPKGKTNVPVTNEVRVGKV